MDFQTENDDEKQNQLRGQMENLLESKRKLQYEIRILTECVSVESLEKKVSELENKQKLLISLEKIYNIMRQEIEPLDFLKELLEKKLMATTLSNDDNKMRKNLEVFEKNVSIKPANRAYDNQTLDSLSDVNSENSVMILSEYNAVSDEGVLNDTDKGANKKVRYDEALRMATSENLTSNETTELNMTIESAKRSLCLSNQIKCNYCILEQSDPKDFYTSMSTHNEILSEMCLKMNEKNSLLNSIGNDQNKLECDSEKNDPTTTRNDAARDNGIKSIEIKEEANVSKLDDSWVKVDSFDISSNPEQIVDICQATTQSHKDNGK